MSDHIESNVGIRSPEGSQGIANVISHSGPVTASSPGSSFTPINNGLAFGSKVETSSQCSALLLPNKETHKFLPDYSDVTQNRSQKRTRATLSDKNTARSKRQLCLPATSSSSPFQTLKVIKSSTEKNISLSKATYGAGTSLYDAVQDRGANSEHMFDQTTMEQLTPYPTVNPRGPANLSNRNPVIQISDVEVELHPADMQLSVPGGVAIIPGIAGGSLGISGDINPINMIVAERTVESRCEFIDPGTQQNTNTELDSDDDYPLNGVMDEDIVGLLDKAQHCHQERNIPPSSVTQAWDHDSRSAAEYDSTLQYSSPLPSSEQTNWTPTTNKPKEAQEYLLDDDVDWDAVHEMTSTLPKDPSMAAFREMESPSRAVESAQREDPVEGSTHADDTTRLKPFVRPPFPEKVRDRSVVPGLSSNIVLRTCFRIGEMINQTVRCFNHQQDAVFELYAKVTYSSRETLARKQHFQFVDLFKDQQPYPAAILSGWRVGSQLDRHSSAFLDTKAGPKLCWSLCRPRRDPKVAVGWTFIVLDITETDWEQISWAKKIVCGDNGQQHKSTATAKL
ncbi:hypothetical protein F5B20DRAFT_240348 [Whalleya microplaca]|nr:hypothetical protein F5B20DRAFT_240348 [Whalleya microplaca]